MTSVTLQPLVAQISTICRGTTINEQHTLSAVKMTGNPTVFFFFFFLQASWPTISSKRVGNQDSSKYMTLLEALGLLGSKHITTSGQISLILLMSGACRSGRKNLFAHGNQKVSLSCCYKQCKPPALVGATLRKKSEMVTWSKLILRASFQVCRSNRLMYWQLPVASSA